MTVSAVWPIQVAIVAALRTHALFVGPPAVGVYDTAAPEGTAGNYVVVGDASEGGFGTLSQRGSTITLTLHIWTVGLSKRVNMDIYSAIRQKLDSQTVTLTGHKVVIGSTRLVTTLRDPDEKYMHGVVAYTVLTLADA